MPISPSTLQEQNLQITVKYGAVQQFMHKYDRWRTRVASDIDKRYNDQDDVPAIKAKVNGQRQQLIPHFITTEEISKKIVLSLISTWEDYEIFFVVLVKKNMAVIQENVVTATDEDAYRDLKAEVLELLNV